MIFSVSSKLFWATCVLVLLGCAHLVAQVSVSGVVVDPDGAAVSKVDVLLHTLDSRKVIGQGTTDAQGHFHLSRITPGDYQLEVPAKYGFELYRAPINITSDTSAALNIQLTPAHVVQDVTVTQEPSQVSLDAASNRDQVTADATMLEKVPVFDQDYIAALTPFLDQTGVATSGVTIIVDGIEMKGTGVSASAIAEAHINNDPYSAETNRPGKGRIEIITKPGTPQIHGTLNYTFRDSATDAKNHFAISKPFEQKRIYEGSVTGPFGSDHKTTFLLSGTRQEDKLQSVVLAEGNVPTPAYDTQFAARLAHDVSPTHRISLQYNVTDSITRNQGVGGLVLSTAGVNIQAREDDVIFNDRKIISPSLLNQLQLFFEKDYDPTRSVVEAQKTVVDGAFNGGGAQADMLLTENNLKINNIVSWSHKHHYVKFGINIPNLSRRAWDDHTNRIGTFSFSSLANYEAMKPYSFTQQTGPGRAIFWMNELGTFIQDQIQLKPNLQASIGLRYDWQTYFKSFHDFAPRLSIAYTTHDHKTVLRGGVGIFYDRSGSMPMADLKRYNGVVLRSFTLLNPTYPAPYPDGTNLNTFPTNLVELEPGGRIPYITNFSFGTERQLLKGLTIAATYRGTIGVALFRSRDVNAPQPPIYVTPPNLNLGVVRQIESEGRQAGNALDLTLNGNAAHWFSGMTQYTFSHTNNNTGGVAWFPANQYSLSGEYGRADFDQHHRFNFLGVFNQDHWLNLGIAAKLYSGTPYTETSGIDSFNTGILNARPVGVNRNTLETRGNTELDLRWSRDIVLQARKTDKTPIVSIAVDAFNISNETNYTSYIGNITSALFAQPTTALFPRRFQFTARLKF